MKLKHTAQFALSFNVKIVDDAGRDVSAFIMPVVYCWLWLPAWVWSWWTAAPKMAMLTGRPRRNRRGRTGAYLSGWRDDLALIGLAAWLLIREGGFADVAV